MRPIVVAGEALVDLIVEGDGSVRSALGGGPYTTARTIGRLGGQVAFLGTISDDRFGSSLRQGLVEAGVDERLIARTAAPTTLALAELDPGSAAHYRFYVDGTAAPGLGVSDALAALDPEPWAIHLGTLGLVFEPSASSLDTMVERMSDRTLLMLDPNARSSAIPDLDAWRDRMGRITARADIIRATTDDMAVLHPGRDPIDAAIGLLEAGPTLVVLTDGARPIHVPARGGDHRTMPVPQIRVVDTVGSGDAFGGAFLAWWQGHGHGRDQLTEPELVSRALEAAIGVAAITCQRAGADPPILADLGGWS